MKRHGHWLTRSENVKRLWRFFVAVLVLTVLPDLLLDKHNAFGFEATFGFNAWYGFATCIALIVVAKLLGAFLKRPDVYYD